MKPIAVLFALAVGLAGCAPYPVYVYQAPVPLVASRAQWDECVLIRQEIIRQQAIAVSSGVMATALVEGAVRLNVANVIAGLQARAAIAGCPV